MGLPAETAAGKKWGEQRELQARLRFFVKDNRPKQTWHPNRTYR